LKSLRTEGRDYSAKKFGNALTVEEFFSQALHFPVHGEQQGIDSDGIQETLAVWDCANGCDGPAILEARECIENKLFADRKTSERGWVMRDDPVGRDLFPRVNSVHADNSNRLFCLPCGKFLISFQYFSGAFPMAATLLLGSAPSDFLPPLVASYLTSSLTRIPFRGRMVIDAKGVTL
jgi:hypothetical protein